MGGGGGPRKGRYDPPYHLTNYLDVRDEGKPLPLESLNVVVNIKTLLKKCSRESQKQYQKKMQEAFIKIATYFQSKLPLSNNFLEDVIEYIHCKDLRSKQIQFQELPNWCPMLYLKAKFSAIILVSVLRPEDTLEEWYLNQDGTLFITRLDYYWIKLFSLKTLSCSQNTPYSLLQYKPVAVYKTEMLQQNVVCLTTKRSCKEKG